MIGTVHLEKSPANCQEYCNQNKDACFPTACFFGGVGRDDREENNKETGPCNLASHWNVASYLKK